MTKIIFINFLILFCINGYAFEGQVKSAYFIDENKEKSWVYLNDISLEQSELIQCENANVPHFPPDGTYIYKGSERLYIIYKGQKIYFEKGFNATWTTEDCQKDFKYLQTFIIHVENNFNLQFIQRESIKSAYFILAGTYHGPQHDLIITERY